MTTPSNLPPGNEAASALAHAGHGIEGGSGWQRREPLVVRGELLEQAAAALVAGGVR